MSGISKLIGGVIGSAVGYGLTMLANTFGFLPDSINSPETIATVTAAIMMGVQNLFVYFFPANSE